MRKQLLTIAATVALGIAASFAVVVVLDRPPRPGRATQAILDDLVPGLVIGERVPVEVRQRYALQVLPYTGFENRAYRDTFGLRELYVTVDEYIDDSRPVVSAQARIENIWFRIGDSARVASLIARLDTALGAPATSCYRLIDSDAIVQQHRWRAESGRDVLLRHQILPPVIPTAGDSASWGWILFSGREGSLQVVPCPAL